MVSYDLGLEVINYIWVGFSTSTYSLNILLPHKDMFLLNFIHLKYFKTMY